MLRLINSISDALLEYIKDDPVRPEIPREFRVSHNRFVAALLDDNRPTSMVCVSMHDFVPQCVEDLSITSIMPTICVAYSVWSYSPGAGKKLIMSVIKDIKNYHPTISRVVTLSPKTEMARKFHLKNGAFILNENKDTVNYEYPNNLWS